VSGFNLVVLGAYKVQGTTKEEFVATISHVEMQHCHLYSARHATRAAKVATTYQTKHDIVDNDMVYDFHFIYYAKFF
jgi:hypothetical protein